MLCSKIERERNNDDDGGKMKIIDRSGFLFYTLCSGPAESDSTERASSSRL